MMIAPHPDDESLAAGVLLQKAVADQAAVRIVYLTDGADNPWPQRILEKRWRLGAQDRARWGKRRRKEAIAALEVLGLEATDARFLGLPDQGLTRALLHDCEKTSARIGRMITDWKPTHLLSPSELDTHPDHNAAALLVRFALDQVSVSTGDCGCLNYIVHGKRPRSAMATTTSRQSAHETVVKRHAIAQHWTQVKFSRRRFMSYAVRPECFIAASDARGATGRGTIREAFRTFDELRFVFRFRVKPFSAEHATLYLVGRDRTGAPLTLRLQLPARSGQIQVTDCATSHRISIATYHGNSFQGTLVMPVALFADDDPVFAKIRRSRWFFDEAGWMAISPSLAAVRDADLGTIKQVVPA